MLERALEQNDSEAYRNFINSINSDITRRDYLTEITYFMAYAKINDYDVLVRIKPAILESLVRDYIIFLRNDRKLSPSTVSSYLAPIAHFYEMNDVMINWRKLKKFKAKYRNIIEDKPYSRQQIKKLVDAAPLRDKAIILVMASGGLRRGAIQYLRIRDLQKIEKYQLYKINVYKKEQESYVTFCTPECTKYIDQYLEWRQRLGEKLQPNSPLFRISFDTDNNAEVNKPKPVSTWVVAKMIHTLLDSSGVRAAAETNLRTELMQTHGFRKFFKTICINAGVHPLYSEYLMGHRSGLTKSYFKPSDNELLEGNEKTRGYIAAINDLTIADEHRLSQKLTEKEIYINELESINQKAMNELRQEVERINKVLGRDN